MEGVRKADHDLRQLGVVVTSHIFNPFDVDTFKTEAQNVTELNYDGILVAPIFFKESLSYLSKWGKRYSF